MYIVQTGIGKTGVTQKYTFINIFYPMVTKTLTI